MDILETVGNGVCSKVTLLDRYPGNLHLNVVADQYTPEVTAALEPFVYELVGASVCITASTISLTIHSARHHGSISAEHGIGIHKPKVLHYSKGEASIVWMKKVKRLFDERGIMNPGKVLPY